MISDLLLNIGASIIYDFGKATYKGLSKQEVLQFALKKMGVHPDLNDFPLRYVEALVEFRFQKKSPTVMAFFREDSIAKVFYNYYYGNENEKANEFTFSESIAHCIEALSVGDAVKEEGINVKTELENFWRVFKQKVQESRTVKEAELIEILMDLQKSQKDFRTQLVEFKQSLQGKSTVQIGEKIYNIAQINEATFGEILKKAPKILTMPPFNFPYFIGREEELKTVHDRLFAGGNFLMLVNGQGGIGKTAFASEYWKRYKSEYTHLAFLFVENGIANALLSLTRALDLQFTTESTEQQLAILIQTVNKLDKPCLLILDNANDEKDLNDNIVGLRKCSNFHILLTSRLSEAPYTEKYPIGTLSKPIAVELFKKHYPLLDASEIPLLEEIYDAVGGNTLVLELLAKNLKNLNPLKKRYTLPQLKTDLQNNLLQLSHSKAIHTEYQAKGTGLRHETPEAIILAMYDLTDLTDTEQALLSVFAVLPAENIEFEVLEKLLSESSENEEVIEMLRTFVKSFDGNTDFLKLILSQNKDLNLSDEQLDEVLKLAQQPKKDTTDLDQTLLALAQKGWIEQSNTAFKISPVIQEITKYKNKQRLEADCNTLVKALTDKLEYLNNRPDYHKDNYKYSTLYAHYAESITKDLSYFQNLTKQRDISILLERVGAFHETTGNLQKALDFYTSANKLEETLHRQHPDDPSHKNGLAISYSKLGETHSSLGNLDKALAFFEEMNKLFAALYAAYPNNVGFKNGLAVSYEKLGETHSLLGNLNKALAFFEKDIELSKELYTAYPNNVGFKNGLAISYEKLGETHRSLGNFDKALAFFEEEKKLKEELYAAYPNNVGFKQGLAWSYQFLGKTHSSLGNLDKALAFYEEMNKLFAELYTAYPNNVNFENGLAISYLKLGGLYLNSDKAKAKAYYLECKNLWVELTKYSPAYVEFQKNLQWVEEVLKALE